MNVNIFFIVLTFIIIIAVILLADSLTTAMLIISMLANFMVISSHFGKVSRNLLGVSARNWGAPPKPGAGLGETKKPERDPDDQDTDMYGPEYEIYHAYQDGYTKCYDEPKSVVAVSCSENSSSIDAMNALMAQRRARDKKCTDGWASKDANYYKHHFAHELDEAEAKPWWSRDEY